MDNNDGIEGNEGNAVYGFIHAVEIEAIELAPVELEKIEQPPQNQEQKEDAKPAENTEPQQSVEEQQEADEEEQTQEPLLNLDPLEEALDDYDDMLEQVRVLELNPIPDFKPTAHDSWKIALQNSVKNRKDSHRRLLAAAKPIVSNYEEIAKLPEAESVAAIRQTLAALRMEDEAQKIEPIVDVWRH